MPYVPPVGRLAPFSKPLYGDEIIDELPATPSPPREDKPAVPLQVERQPRSRGPAMLPKLSMRSFEIPPQQIMSKLFGETTDGSGIPK